MMIKDEKMSLTLDKDFAHRVTLDK